MATASTRLRFEVLRRCRYACWYCGARARDGAKLTVDAVMPEALGGSHKDPANLVAACQECNGGKSSTIPEATLVADVAEHAATWAEDTAAATRFAQRLLDSLDPDDRDAAVSEASQKGPAEAEDRTLAAVNCLVTNLLTERWHLQTVLQDLLNLASGGCADALVTAERADLLRRRLPDNCDASVVAAAAGEFAYGRRVSAARALLDEAPIAERKAWLAQGAEVAAGQWFAREHDDVIEAARLLSEARQATPAAGDTWG